jgi:hypothetical protein
MKRINDNIIPYVGHDTVPDRISFSWVGKVVHIHGVENVELWIGIRQDIKDQIIYENN